MKSTLIVVARGLQIWLRSLFYVDIMMTESMESFFKSF